MKHGHIALCPDAVAYHIQICPFFIGQGRYRNLSPAAADEVKRADPCHRHEAEHASGCDEADGIHILAEIKTEERVSRNHRYQQSHYAEDHRITPLEIISLELITVHSLPN